MRLNKYLAQAGVASRRKADELIQAATTTVNGKLVLDPALEVGLEDIVAYDGRQLSIKSKTELYILNKPAGIITTVSDERGRRSVVDLVPSKERLFPIGRLDRDTTGLVLLTNDGDLANRLAHPRWRIPRIYNAVVDHSLSNQEISRMAKGMFIGEGEFGKAEVLKQVTVKSRTEIILRLRRGKKREIRRLFHYLNRKLFSLNRTQFGKLELGDLPIGHYRQLSEQEVRELKGSLNGH